jgi:hypothetical protein
MQQEYIHINRRDPLGNPAGGFAILALDGHGESVELPDDMAEVELALPALFIRWQNGPLMVDGVRRSPDGAFVETVLAVARDRLLEYQGTKHACEENDAAIAGIDAALAALHARTAKRTALGIEGTTLTVEDSVRIATTPPSAVAQSPINPAQIGARDDFEPSHPAQPYESLADVPEGELVMLTVDEVDQQGVIHAHFSLPGEPQPDQPTPPETEDAGADDPVSSASLEPTPVEPTTSEPAEPAPAPAEPPAAAPEPDATPAPADDAPAKAAAKTAKKSK